MKVLSLILMTSFFLVPISHAKRKMIKTLYSKTVLAYSHATSASANYRCRAEVGQAVTDTMKLINDNYLTATAGGELSTVCSKVELFVKTKSQGGWRSDTDYKKLWDRTHYRSTTITVSCSLRTLNERKDIIWYNKCLEDPSQDICNEDLFDRIEDIKPFQLEVPTIGSDKCF